MSASKNISIVRDATGNVLITGDSNIVVIQTSHAVELKEATDYSRIGPNPYKGLAAFREKDANEFFGREILIDELWRRFRALGEPQPGASPPRILPVIGASGSGKSSVVRAGLIPELARRPIT